MAAPIRERSFPSLCSFLPFNQGAGSTALKVAGIGAALLAGIGAVFLPFEAALFSGLGLSLLLTFCSCCFPKRSEEDPRNSPARFPFQFNEDSRAPVGRNGDPLPSSNRNRHVPVGRRSSLSPHHPIYQGSKLPIRRASQTRESPAPFAGRSASSSTPTPSRIHVGRRTDSV